MYISCLNLKTIATQVLNNNWYYNKTTFLELCKYFIMKKKTEVSLYLNIILASSQEYYMYKTSCYYFPQNTNAAVVLKRKESIVSFNKTSTQKKKEEIRKNFLTTCYFMRIFVATKKKTHDTNCCCFSFFNFLFSPEVFLMVLKIWNFFNLMLHLFQHWLAGCYYCPLLAAHKNFICFNFVRQHKRPHTQTYHTAT